jgi:hypothetical protein
LFAFEVPEFEPFLIGWGELGEWDFEGAEVDIDLEDALGGEVEEFGLDGFALEVGQVAELAGGGRKGETG